MRTEDVTLKQIEAFHKAATSDSLAAAARELGLTRAAVSRSIKMLEQALCQPLFCGLGRRRQMTEAAETLLPHAAQAIGAWQALRTTLEEIERPGQPISKRASTRRSPRQRGRQSHTKAKLQRASAKL